MENLLRVLTRIIALPFFIALHGCFMLRGLIYMTAMWLWYGGESIIYKKGEQHTIAQVWDKLTEITKDK